MAVRHGITVSAATGEEGDDGSGPRRCEAGAQRDLIVTSEEPLLRGPDELRAFPDRYVGGEMTYSWEWNRHDVSIAGSLAWLLAEGPNRGEQ